VKVPGKAEMDMLNAVNWDWSDYTYSSVATENLNFKTKFLSGRRD
jgi:hypothetical protein